MIKLCEKEKCTACAACQNICPKGAISFVENKEGFVYPAIEEKICVRCGACQKVCPQFGENTRKEFANTECYVVWARNDLLREKSSSGGIFAATAKWILDNKGVVFGAAFDEGCYTVSHIMIDNIDELSRLQGSKYVQSDIGNSYKQCKTELQAGRKVLFSGTPCQIDGLHHFLKKQYANLFTIDILCHGVPSQKILLSYIEDIEKRYKSKVDAFEFRDKNTYKGWENSCHTRITFQSGKVITSDSEASLFWNSFLSNIYLRESCYQCAYAGKQRVGDITIGDFWGIKDLPTEIKFKGVSFVLVNTQNGKMLFDKAEVDFEKRKISDAIGKNRTLQTSFPKGQNRELFFNTLWKSGFKKAVYKSIPKQMFRNNIFIFTHKVLGDKAYKKLRQILMKNQ